MTLKLFKIFGLAAILATAGCDDPSPIEIGFVGGLSGRVADLGVAALDGVRLALEEQNRKGGINGHPLRLNIEDDRQDSGAVRAGLEELSARQVEAVIGPMTSAMAVAAAPIANERRIALLSPTVTTRDLAGQDDYFLRVIADTRQYAEASAKFHWQRRNIKSFVILADQLNRAYTDSWAQDFRGAYEALGGKVPQILPFRSGQVGDFAALARQAIAIHAEAVLILANAADAAQISQQIRLVDPRVPMVTSEWAATERFVELAGPAAEGVFTAQFVDRESDLQPYAAFRRLFLERFQQEPGFAGIAGYDAACVLITALRQREAGETIRDAVLRIGDFQGLQGPIHIDRFGDSWRPTYITMVKGGKYMRIN